MFAAFKQSRWVLQRYHLIVCMILLIEVSMMTATTEASGTGKYAGGYTFWYSKQISEIDRDYIMIDAKGNVTGNVKFSQSGGEPREVGWFFLPLHFDDPDLTAIGRLIWEKKLIGGKVHEYPFRPGMREKVFSIKAGGLEARHSFNAMVPLPEEISMVEEVVDRLFQRLKDGPLRTFSIAVALEPLQGTPGSMLRLNFEIRNSGKFPAEIPNPALFTAKGPGMIRINIWKTAANNSAESSDEYVTTIDLAGYEFLAAERKAVPSDKSHLVISPKEKIRFWTTIAVPNLKPDLYELEIVYYGGPLPDDEMVKHPDRISGEYHANPIKIVILKK